MKAYMTGMIEVVSALIRIRSDVSFRNSRTWRCGSSGPVTIQTVVIAQ